MRPPAREFPNTAGRCVRLRACVRASAHGTALAVALGVVALVAASCTDAPTLPGAGADASRPPGLWAVAQGADRLVAVGKRETWSTSPAPSSTWKALADTAVVVWSGDDGASWNPVDPPVRLGWVKDVAFGNGAFVAVGGVGDWVVAAGYVLRSEDGEHWTAHGAPLGLKCNWITFLAGHFFASCSEGGVTDRRNAIARSADGVTWERVATFEAFDAPITSGGDVLVRWSGGDLHSSEDGATWHPHPGLFPEVEDGNPVRATIRSVRHVGGAFIGSAVTEQVIAPCCTGARRAYTLRSVDGRQWGAEPIEGVVGLEAHAQGGGVWVGVGSGGFYRATSPGEWSRVHPQGAPVGQLYFDVVFAGGRFVAVGNGPILSSVDGLDWSATPVPLP